MWNYANYMHRYSFVLHVYNVYYIHYRFSRPLCLPQKISKAGYLVFFSDSRAQYINRVMKNRSAGYKNCFRLSPAIYILVL